MNENYLAMTEGVKEFLSELGLEQYYNIFVTKGFDSETDVQNLQDADLDQMGITDRTHRQLLLTAAYHHTSSDEYKLYEWLRQHQLEYYLVNFLQSDLTDFRDLANLNLPNEDLYDELELVLPGHRRRLERAIRQLRKRQKFQDSVAEEPLAVGRWGKPSALVDAKYDFLCVEAVIGSTKNTNNVRKMDFMVDSGSDVVTLRQEILEGLDLELLGTVRSKGVHASREKSLYKAKLMIGDREIEIEVMPESYDSLGSRVIRHFRHFIDGNRHVWLPGNYTESVPLPSRQNSPQPTVASESISADPSSSHRQEEDMAVSSEKQNTACANLSSESPNTASAVMSLESSDTECSALPSDLPNTSHATLSTGSHNTARATISTESSNTSFATVSTESPNTAYATVSTESPNTACATISTESSNTSCATVSTESPNTTCAKLGLSTESSNTACATLSTESPKRVCATLSNTWYATTTRDSAASTSCTTGSSESANTACATTSPGSPNTVCTILRSDIACRDTQCATLTSHLDITTEAINHPSPVLSYQSGSLSICNSASSNVSKSPLTVIPPTCLSSSSECNVKTSWTESIESGVDMKAVGESSVSYDEKGDPKQDGTEVSHLSNKLLTISSVLGKSASRRRIPSENHSHYS